MKALILSLIFLLSSAAAFAQGESAPIVEKDFEYKAWTFRSLTDDSPRDIRSMIAGKKLVIVAYFAPWCPNWKHDAPFIKQLHDKYKDKGLEIIGVGEYAAVDAMRLSLDNFKLSIPTVYESTERTDRNNTSHFETRRKAGDTRGWGSPWYIFIEPAKTEAKGNVLLKRASVINGEMIEAEVEAFIQQKLGLDKPVKAAATNSKTIEKCDPATAELKGP